MLLRRSRKLGGFLPGRGSVEVFVICAGEPDALACIERAKLEGDAACAAAVKRVFDRYLARYFPPTAGWFLTVPRGRGGDSFVVKMWRDDPRFLRCFDHNRPLDVAHHWAARLGGYPTIRVRGEVAGKFIVVVDDVMTTGTTLTGHLVALLKAGAYATGLVLSAHS